MKVTTARRVGEPGETLDPAVEKLVTSVARALYESQAASLGAFMRAMGLNAEQAPPHTRMFRVAERSDVSLQVRWWFTVECKSTNLDCTIRTAVLFNPETAEIDAIKYSIDAGEGVPAFQLVPVGQDRWMYTEVIVKRFGAVNSAVLAETMSKSLERAIRADMKAFRGLIDDALSVSKSAILQLIRVGEYKT